jgi:hypothetical protein
MKRADEGNAVRKLTVRQTARYVSGNNFLVAEPCLDEI